MQQGIVHIFEALSCMQKKNSVKVKTVYLKIMDNNNKMAENNREKV